MSPEQHNSSARPDSSATPRSDRASDIASGPPESVSAFRVQLPLNAKRRLFGDRSEMANLISDFNWSATPLGPVETWSQSLRSLVKTLLASRYPMVLIWGPSLIQFYNDAYSQLIGSKHPAALGIDIRVTLAEAWNTLSPMIEKVMQTGEANWTAALLLVLERSGYREESYFSVSHSPAEDDDGQIVGMFGVCSEVTQQVLGERRLRLLRDLSSKSGEIRSVAATCQDVVAAIAAHPLDVPFALLYLREPNGNLLTLQGCVGIEDSTAACPPAVDCATEDSQWSLAAAMRGETVLIEAVDRRVTVPGGPWQEPVQSALAMPIMVADQTLPQGVLVVGISPNRALDESYRSFYELLAGQVSVSLRNAQAYEEERRRAETLAKLDRAKTTFFSNVSHEFRTPLTLMLGPLEAALDSLEGRLQSGEREQLLMVQRNGLRLLKLVNNLLDFSRIEADRVQAEFQPTDLSQFTADLASTFRSAVEIAGLRLVIDCPPIPEPVYVDQSMWEKIVLNLLSNAFKFTFEGEIRVNLRWVERDAGTRGRGDAGSQEDAGTWGHGDAGTWEYGNAENPASPATAVVDLSPFPRLPLPASPSPSFPLPVSASSVVLEICDTGIGIAAAELPHLFERFHQVEGARGRTHEGSGIGLSLVQELVKLHGGQVAVASEVGQGTTFTVVLPLGQAHLPAEAVRMGASSDSVSLQRVTAAPYVEEALRWLPEEVIGARSPGKTEQSAGAATVSSASSGSSSRARILLADDNADMRDYVRRLLSQHYAVETVANGRDALRVASTCPLDLILSDVMMPELDGLALLQALRSEPRTREIPVILLSARAGEESRIEGLQTGADDYLIKPFSARELLARVEANLEAAQLRRATLVQREQMLQADRRRLEETLAEREADLRLITNAVPVLISYVDAGQRYRFNNRGYEEWFGYSANELYGKHLREVLGEATYSATWPYIEQALSGQQVTYEHWVTLKDRGRRYISATYVPRYGKQGQVEGFVALITDISDRKQHEQEREQLLTRERTARAEAEAANRLKDEFLAIVSHELRTPLNSILGWSHLLLNRKLDEAATVKGLSTIWRNGNLQNKLIDDILDIARIVQGKLQLELQPVSLVTLIDAVIEEVRPTAEAKDLHIESFLDPSVGPVLGDTTRLQQIVCNLLSNAVKFTPNGGHISVHLRQIGAQAQITVDDTGQGIPASLLPYIFDRFRQGDSSRTRSQTGLGLGLAIVKSLVEMHQGEIQVASAGEGKGATFTVLLPTQQGQQGFLTHSATDQNGLPDLTDWQILVIDDDENTRELTAFILEQLQAQVTVAASAQVGFAEILKGRPDVLICDIGMPEEDGYSLIRRVRAWEAEQELPLIPALALTAFTREEDKQAALVAGFQQYLAKPVDPDQLAFTVASLPKQYLCRGR
ncbi:MAG: response regulator [Cyanobacteria bacterium Co-bin13]|nr:response regulator [Cyanobacteria bacterium Co-bin13]